MCGTCLVASTEMIRKLPQWERLPHGYGCVAIKDVNDVAELSGKLAAIVRQPELAAAVGARGRAFATGVPGGRASFRTSSKESSKLRRNAERCRLPRRADIGDDTAKPFPSHRLQRLVSVWRVCATAQVDWKHARQILTEFKKAATAGQSDLQPFASAVEAEIAVAAAMTEIASQGESADPLFRVNMDTWALDSRSLGNLLPVRDAKLRILRFEHDLSALQGVVTADDFPTRLDPGPSYMVVAGGEPLLVDRFTARFLELSNGTQTVEQIIDLIEHEFGYAAEASRLAWIEELLVSGLIGVRASKKSV